MPKKLFVTFTFLALILAGCAQPGTGSATQPASQTPPPAATVQSAATHEPGCTVISRQATPDPTMEAILPPPTKGDWAHGPEDATVTLIEYSDFQ